MKKLHLILLSIFLGFSLNSLAQNGQINGKTYDVFSNKPLKDIKVMLIPIGITAETDEEGNFTLNDVPYGKYTIQYSGEEMITVTRSVQVNDPIVNIGNVPMSMVTGDLQTISDDVVPSVTGNDDGESASDNNISGILSASRDVYLNVASYTFGQARFNLRGYRSDNFQVMINGITMNELENNNVYWSNWGGLNDMFRYRDNSYGLEANNFTIGEVGGASNTDATAYSQRKQFRASYALSNRSYTHRLMATYSTGVLKNGWAFSASASYRVANKSYMPGTFYDSWAYFLAASKKIGEKNFLHLTVFGVPTRRGKTAPAVQEMLDLADDNYYNPVWGYQEGKIRNSRVFKSHQPTFILSHVYNIDKTSSLNTAIGFQFGETSNSALNWYNAPNPNPDYYRNLPSNQVDSGLAAQMYELYSQIEAARQINWAKLYEVNALSQDTIYDADGIVGNTVTGKRSRYVVEERVQRSKDLTFNTYYNKIFKKVVEFSAGLNYRYSQSRNFKRINDLLGGDYFVDLNQFAELAFQDNVSNQNNIETPNRIVREGDEYGYNFIYTHHKAGAWAQAKVNFKKVEFFGAAGINFVSYWRTGLWKTGLFPDNSKGKSEVFNFINPTVKGGVTYKINGRNYIFANASYMTRAPYIFNVFLSPNTRNQTASNVVNEQITSTELGYTYNSPRVKIKAVGYFTQFLNGTETKRYWHDQYNSNVNQTMTNIDRQYYGGEFGVEGNIYKGFGMNAVMGIGQGKYIDRPNLTLTSDNTSEILLENETVYFKNFYTATGPQWANSLGVFYNSPKYWFVRLNANWYDWIFVEANPIRRTGSAVEGLEQGSELYDLIVDQERLPGQFTLDLFGGYSWRLNNTFKNMKGGSKYINFTLSISNLTNNTKFRTNGFEQLRFDFTDRNPNKFAPKYFYNYGINAFLNITFRM